MRHRVKGRKLNRTASHRAALMNALATSLLKHKRIKTTVAKAKETRSYVETLITKARKNDLHSMRQVMSHIRIKKLLRNYSVKLFRKLVTVPADIQELVKLGNRMGDAASMAILELVDYNDVINEKAEEKKEKREERRAK